MYSWIYIKKKKGEGAIIMDNYYTFFFFIEKITLILIYISSIY